jgi:NADP-dependent 3-hydroxy acid dehydrogenase YdfG
MAAPLVIITGASHGIGLAVAQAFAREGHPLLLIARHKAAIDGLGDTPYRFAEADVADFASLKAAVEEAETAFGPTGCLVNNAGFLHIGNFRSRPVDDLDHDVDVLLKGVIRRLTGNPDFIAPERIAEIILFCYKQPQAICIRDLVVMPTTSAF